MDAHTNYNEQAVLTMYVWNNFRHLRTDDENLAEHAITVEVKMGPHLFRSEPLPRLATERERYKDNTYVQKALELGLSGLQKMVKDRITKEMPPTFFVNRCPQCQRILATPKAQQCLWCGADWHNTEAS